MMHFFKIKLLKYLVWNNTKLFPQQKIKAEGRFKLDYSILIEL
jgi:hypothetical protein